MSPLRTFLLFAALLPVLSLVGCATTDHPRTAQLAPGEYDAAFRRTLDELTRLGFQPERVDAAGGVITTQPARTAGLAQPWSRQQTVPGQEIEDLLNSQQRSVRVTFRPAGGSPGDPAFVDMRSYGGPIEADVRVVLERIERPGREISPVSVRLQWRTEDPALRERRLHPQHAVPVGRDRRLEKRIAERTAGG